MPNAIPSSAPRAHTPERLQTTSRLARVTRVTNRLFRFMVHLSSIQRTLAVRKSPAVYNRIGLILHWILGVIYHLTLHCSPNPHGVSSHTRKSGFQVVPKA